MKVRKYTRELVGPAVASSTTLTEAYLRCGAKKVTGSGLGHFSKVVKGYGIDTSHWLGKHNTLGRNAHNRRSWQDVLIKRSNGMRQRARTPRRALIESGREYKCETCGLRQWRKKRITLEVEHKDGDFQNDSPDNLEFICPNCHSQTETFGRRLNGEKHHREEPWIRKIKKESDPYWRTKNRISKRKVQRPNPAELLSLMQSMSMVKIGDKFGVSDNAVRKWAKRYGMEIIRARSKMEKRRF
jgi:predicted RNA-binding Zn-ribbon protein involved in translation (DUF1610 family)